jgi:DEAD/DEAH box helicase
VVWTSRICDKNSFSKVNPPKELEGEKKKERGEKKTKQRARRTVMGIRGLTSRLRSLGLLSPPGGSEGTAHVDLETFLASQKEEGEEEHPRVLVDAPSLVHWLNRRQAQHPRKDAPRVRFADGNGESTETEELLFRLTLPDLEGGIVEELRAFVAPFVAAGCHLEFYFDSVSGTPESERKLPVLCHRADEKIDSVLRIQDHVTGVQRLTTRDLENVNILPPGSHGAVVRALMDMGEDTCKIVRVLGEADFALMRDGPAATVVLSDDSDLFFAPGLRVAPLSSVRRSAAGKVSLDVTNSDAVAQHLGVVNPTQFADLSALIGNDYTGVLLDDTDLALRSRISAVGSELVDASESSILRESDLPDVAVHINRCVAVVNDSEQCASLMKELRRSFPEFGEQCDFTHRVMWRPGDIVAAGLDTSSTDDGELVDKVLDGSLPSSILGASRHGWLLSSVVIEQLDLHTPSTARVCHVLNAAFFALANREGTEQSPCTQYERRDLRYGVTDIHMGDLLPRNYPVGLPGPSETHQLRIGRISRLLSNLKCSRAGSTSDDGELVEKLLAEDSGFGMVAALFVIGLSAHCGDALSIPEIVTVVSMVALCGRKAVPNEQADPLQLNMRMFTVFSRFMGVSTALGSLCKCVGLKTPPPQLYSHGPLFAQLWEHYQGSHVPDTPRPAQALARDSKPKWIGEEAQLEISQALFQLQAPFGGPEYPDPSHFALQESSEVALQNVMEGLDELTLDEPDDDNHAPAEELDPAEVAKSLPVAAHRDDILDAVEHEPVVVIEADTGAGKSSQVPQYLLDSHTSESPFILCTQPRRIAAISLAKRVAAERHEPVGHTVGFAIGQERVASLSRTHPTRIMFVTSGWLLQKLLHDAEFFQRCSHIVLDEIHERSIDADLLTLLLKEMLIEAEYSGIRAPRLVLMSATLNANLFAEYFRLPVAHPEYEDWDEEEERDVELRRVPVLSVGTHRFETTILHLDELNTDLPGIDKFTIQRICRAQRSPTSFLNKTEAHSLRDIAIALMTDVAYGTYEQQDAATILIFLPGMFDLEVC